MGFPGQPGGHAEVPVLLFAVTGRSRMLPVTWVLWPGMRSPNPRHLKQLSAAPAVDTLLFAPTVLCRASGPQTYDISCRLASVERKWCGPHLPHQKMALGPEFWVHLLLDFYQEDLKTQEAGWAAQRASTLYRNMLDAVNKTKQQFELIKNIFSRNIEHKHQSQHGLEKSTCVQFPQVSRHNTQNIEALQYHAGQTWEKTGVGGEIKPVDSTILACHVFLV